MEGTVTKVITDYLRRKRSANMAIHDQEEVDCPTCKGRGTMTQKQTRVAGSHMNRHMSEKHSHDGPCSCPRSTISVTIDCIRCGGYGTVPRRKEKVENPTPRRKKKAA